jgi:predicted polyphosphate/ATP-dependent NAD kinase
LSEQSGHDTCADLSGLRSGMPVREETPYPFEFCSRRCFCNRRNMLLFLNTLPVPVRVGFLVNPIAGMGGSVGLKGTDGEGIMGEALRRGASKTSPLRASGDLTSVRLKRLDIEWLTCAGEMGKDELDSCGLVSRVVHELRGETSRRDTVAAVRSFVDENAALVVFAGGDGTARDVLEVADKRVPILGVPTGVKMQSAVFVNRPEDLGDILMTYVGSGVTKEAEVMDINEEAFREGIVEAKLYGIALVPDDAAHLQSSKMSYHSGTADDEAAEIGQYIADTMEDGVLYIIGPGSTTAAIAKALREEKTLLGADAYLSKKLVVRDGGEREILEALQKAQRARIVVSPVGAQGFFFGRGNQQLSAKVVRRVGTENVIIVATPTKLRETQPLRVDTGDAELDKSFSGKVKVVTGYKRKKLVDVV